MNYEDGKAYCTSIGATIAAIYTTAELTTARDVIAAAGIEKAITAAECTSTGWTWHGTDSWESNEFPLNTGDVTDAPDCSDGNHVYSLHASGDSFVWDADGKTEMHPALCRVSDDQGTTTQGCWKSWHCTGETDDSAYYCDGVGVYPCSFAYYGCDPAD